MCEHSTLSEERFFAVQLEVEVLRGSVRDTCELCVQVAHRVVEEAREEGEKEGKKKEVTIRTARLQEETEEGPAEEAAPEAAPQVQSQSADTSTAPHPAATSPHVTVR